MIRRASPAPMHEGLMGSVPVSGEVLEHPAFSQCGISFRCLAIQFLDLIRSAGTYLRAASLAARYVANFSGTNTRPLLLQR